MTLAYTLILELMLVPAILLWPDMRRAAAALHQVVPFDFMRNLLDQVMSPDEEVAYRAWIAVQMFFKGVNVVGIAAAVLMGTTLVARERENQTLEFLLARPVSRSRILGAKFGVVAAAIVVPIFVTSWSAIPLSAIPSVDHDLPIGAVTTAAFHNACFVLAILAITTLFSVTARSQVQTAFWIGALVIVQLALYFIPQIRVASAFALSDFELYGPVMAGNRGFVDLFSEVTVWVLAATAAVYFAADRLFRRIEI